MTISEPAKTDLREGLMWLALLASVRIGAMFIFGWLTGNQHFTDDWERQSDFINDPFQLILVREGLGASYYPPLQPIATFLLGYPFVNWLPSFYSIRCFSILAELMAWPFVWALFTRAVAQITTRRILAMAYILAPVGWMTTSMFAQEEPLSLLFLAATLLAAWKGKLNTAIVVASIGVVTAKVYFLIALLALVLAPPLRPLSGLAKRLVLAAAPVLFVYGVVAVSAWSQGKAIPLSEFTPHGVHSTSIWVLIRAAAGTSLETTKHLSMLTGLLAGIIPLVVAKARNVRIEGLTLVRIVVGMQLFVYMWFYHCDPEYYLIVLPFVLISFPVRAAVAISTLGFSVPYAINLFYAVERAGRLDVGSGKSVFVRLYNKLIPFEPATMHTLSLFLLCGISLFITIWLTRMIARSSKTA